MQSKLEQTALEDFAQRLQQNLTAMGYDITVRAHSEGAEDDGELGQLRFPIPNYSDRLRTRIESNPLRSLSARPPMTSVQPELREPSNSPRGP